MAWLTRSTIQLMVTVLAGITVERPSGAVWRLAIAGNFGSACLLLAPSVKLYCSWRAGTLAEVRATYAYGFDFWGCLMWICFAVLYLPLPNSKIVLGVNSVGAAAQIAYLMLCIWYTSWNQHRRAIAVFVTGAISSGVVLALILTKTIAHSKAIQIVGGLAIGIGLLGSLCTFCRLVMMIRARNVSGMDILSVVVALPTGCIWVSYGCKFHPVNIFIVVPNAVSLGIALAQSIAAVLIILCNPAPPEARLPVRIPPPAPSQIELPVVAHGDDPANPHLVAPSPPATDDRADDPAILHPVAPPPPATDDRVDDPANLHPVAPPPPATDDRVDDPAKLPPVTGDPVEDLNSSVNMAGVRVDNLTELSPASPPAVADDDLSSSASSDELPPAPAPASGADDPIDDDELAELSLVVASPVPSASEPDDLV